jgi:hypothetical protein
MTPLPPIVPHTFHRLAIVGGQDARPGVDLNNSDSVLALMEHGEFVISFFHQSEKLDKPEKVLYGVYVSPRIGLGPVLGPVL